MRFEEMIGVLLHGAWADGSSWASVIAQAQDIKAVAAPLPLWRRCNVRLRFPASASPWALVRGGTCQAGIY